MPSRTNLLLAPSFLALVFLFMPETCWGEETVPSAITETDVDADSDDSDTDKHSARKTKPGSVDANGFRLPEGPLSLAQVTETTERVVVYGLDVEPPAYPALPEVEGTRINSGKKTSFVKPEEFPTISNNNYREALATTPGLLVSEEPNSPIINIGYRGLDSQRAEFSQVLKDGISIKNEQFGFPETHYTPILDAVERIEFVRTGAALQFGPQPGGAVNFIMKMPGKDAPFHFLTKNLFGSDDLFQSFTEVDGTSGQLGYYVYYDHREREGFRQNSDYNLDNGSVRLVYEVSNNSRFILTGDFYDEEHGEPGGLRTTIDPTFPADQSVLYQVDRNASSRLFDRFRLKRYYGMLEFQHLFSEQTELDLKAFGGYLSRFSKRQRGGGVGVAPAEITPTLPLNSPARTNSIQLREVWNEGAEARLRHDYQLAGDTSTFAGGVYFYHALQDRDDQRGLTPDADSGTLRNFATGETTDFSIFAENRFHFGRLSIIPGMRLESLWQKLDETVNVTRPNDLHTADDFSFVPLFSLGLGYVLVEGQQSVTSSAKDAKDAKSMSTTSTMVAGGPPRLELYGTAAQAYRPRTYGELVPTSATGIVAGDLKEGDALEFELGLRGKPLPYLTFDFGGFYYTFEDQIDTIGNLTLNVGDARYAGFEAAMELDVLAMANGGAESPYGSLNLYANVTWLDAEFTGGPNNGNVPAYAPDYQFKVGGIYRWKDRAKVALLGTMVDDHFANAGNAPTHFVPAYQVWDLTAEWNFCNGRFGVFGGVNNLFDEDFWAEVRDEGILPAYRRNYYGGFKIRF
jgi:Fe(3+) dicitrate transport protein